MGIEGRARARVVAHLPLANVNVTICVYTLAMALGEAVARYVRAVVRVRAVPFSSETWTH